MPEASIPIEGKNIALVGGAGFIGHHLALRLNELGAHVTIVDSLSVNNYYSLKQVAGTNWDTELYLRMIEQRRRLLTDHGVPLIEQDARDYNALSQIMDTLRPQVIVHLAAVAHANKSNKDPFSTFDHSLRTLENMLDIARSEGSQVEHFIYLSSSMVYGQFPSGGVNEETPCKPLGIYGALKFAGEKLVIAHNQVFDLPYTIVRPSALYGERCVSRRVIQLFIEHAMRGERVTVNGDGSDRLDFTYIEDLVQGLVRCIEKKKARGQIFNLTYGASRSISDVVDILNAQFPELDVTHKEKDQLTPDRGTLEIDKARVLLDYQPHNPIEVAVPKYVDWYCSSFRKEEFVAP